ncbi:helix-turn-helix domain-containing protein [Hymenobacter perfusus]|uniref:AraC family transcriptional regulator n=1 Tax=Hymenobacter perfusus TaxID=1236770 RepID=A0A428K1E2_9BACT|nr:helix-turn-helix domain-containing protein [Hymenobacter perfusus]RSK40173.1 AraC family transcriptional regulator [Hymenobacter perfusus]
MLLNEIKPAAHLVEFVRLYRIIDFRFPAGTVIPPKHYSPRPEQCLQFYPRDPETVQYLGTSSAISGKPAVLTGQHTVLSMRQVGADFLSVQVVFQPGGFHRLLGVSMPELVNLYLDAEQVLGPSVREVSEQLAAAPSYTAMVLVIEQFLGRLLRRARPAPLGLDRVAQLMLHEEAPASVDWFARESCLCNRQFDRRFRERVGIAPKQFLQIVRFDRAYRLKNRCPQLDWLSVALRCGYHDYQHLAKDYKELTGYTPVQFWTLDNQAPERAFGDAEI